MILTEEKIPYEGIEETISELVDLYGGEMQREEERRREFILPLRRGAAAGGVACSVSWVPQDAIDATVTMSCDRELDAPRLQRILLLAAGVIGALLFTIWPFMTQRRGFGTLAWLGGAMAIAVYFLTLKRTSGGLAFDFLQRLARRQRGE